jgi:hypothetical protein
MNKFQEELRKRSFGYITTAFGLVAGLAWNEAIKAFIERFFPMSTGGMIAKFVYAVLITVILVFVSVYILKVPEKESKAEKK